MFPEEISWFYSSISKQNKKQRRGVILENVRNAYKDHIQN